MTDSIGYPEPAAQLGERIAIGRTAEVVARGDGQITRHPWKVDGLARAFGGLHAGMHGASGAGLADLKAELRKRIEWAADEVGGFPVEPVFGRLVDLADGAAVCHGDMHPGDVILAPSGPTVIDWMTATCGPPEADLARTEFP
jgi:hypothetical protein